MGEGAWIARTGGIGISIATARIVPSQLAPPGLDQFVSVSPVRGDHWRDSHRGVHVSWLRGESETDEATACRPSAGARDDRGARIATLPFGSWITSASNGRPIVTPALGDRRRQSKQGRRTQESAIRTPTTMKPAAWSERSDASATDLCERSNSKAPRRCPLPRR